MNNDAHPISAEPVREPVLDPEVCRRARLSRDVRFDGEFYIAVHTTGIYCRPICPARTPAEKNVSYFQSAALAAQAGFRPCLRCRPESAPNSPAWNGTSTTVQRALQLISQGALNDGSVATWHCAWVSASATCASCSSENWAYRPRLWHSINACYSPRNYWRRPRSRLLK